MKFELDTDLPSAPHQVLVRLVHSESNLESYAPVKKSKTAESKYFAVIDVKTEAAKLKHKSGEYSLTLLVSLRVCPCAAMSACHADHDGSETLL